MAKEIQYYGELFQTGLSLVAQVYDGDGIQVGGDIPCVETGTSAIYICDMPITPAGIYGIRIVDNGFVIGQGTMYWDGEFEITSESYVKIDELHKLQGLALSKPMVVTPTSRTVDTIELGISTDGSGNVTVERL